MNMKDELSVFQRTEPLVLLLGENFDKVKDVDITQMKWSCVYSLKKDADIIDLFNNDRRKAKSILLPSDLDKISWNVSEMPFVWLLGHDEFISEKRNEIEIESDAINMFEYVKKKLGEFGRIVCVGFDLNSNVIDAKEIAKLCYSLKRKKFFYFLSFVENELKKDKRFFDLIENDFVVCDNDSISDIFFDSIEDLEMEEDDINSDTLIFAGGSPISFSMKEEKEAIFFMSRFAELLSYRNVMKNVSIPREQKHIYFKNFIKNENNGTPQWFGYRKEYGFHLVRDFEADLYKKTKDALEDAGTRKRTQKPIMLCGQACSGKTSALKALAVNIFLERKYPVIYISNSELDFNKAHTDEGVEMQYSAFDRLEDVLRIIEGKEEKAVATLIIWDTAAHNSISRNKANELLTALRSCGRRVQLVCSSYDFKKEQKDFYDIVEVDIKMPETEWERLSNFFHKVGLSENEEEIYLKRYGESANFLSTLYLIDELKECLQDRVSHEVVLGTEEMAREIEEAIGSDRKDSLCVNFLAEALKKAFCEAGEYFYEIYHDFDIDRKEMERDYKDFVIMLAICTWYRKEMPYTLLLRLLGGYSSESRSVYNAVLSATFLNFKENEEDYWKSTVCVRNELEANLLLKNEDIDPLSREGKEVMLNYVLRILDQISENTSEISMMRGILKSIGPNVEENTLSNKSLWNEVYERIPEIFERLSIKRREGDKNYILQEISYRREYFQDNRCELSDVEKYKKYDDTKRIADSKIEDLKREEEILGTKSYGMSPILSNLLVESAYITMRMHQLKCAENQIGQSIFGAVNKLLMDVIKRDPKNAYSYSAVIQAGLQQIEDDIKYSENYSKESLTILKKISSLSDVFRHSKVKYSDGSIKAMRKLEASVNEKMDRVNGDEKLFQESINNKRPEMIYFRVNKMLRDCKDFENEKVLCNHAQIEITESAIQLMDSYKEITYVDGACLYRLINLKWMLYNKVPLLGNPECSPTKLSKGEWEELEALCERYDLYKEYSQDNISYLHALCLAERNDFKKAIDILKPYRESRRYEKRAMHILCDEDGNPKKFKGRLKNNYDEERRRGYMAIYHDRELLYDNVIYRAENIHKKPSDLKRDEKIDVEISISFSGIQAHTKSKTYKEFMEEEK